MSNRFRRAMATGDAVRRELEAAKKAEQADQGEHADEDEQADDLSVGPHDDDPTDAVTPPDAPSNTTHG